MTVETLKAEIARNFSTPALVVDLDIVDRNIARVQVLCDAAGVANRPHIKTHKSPRIAAMQRDAGAKGITCQKLGEAEVMADAGFDDILITYNLLGEEKLGRLGRLLARAEVVVCADNPTTIAGLPAAAAIAGRPLGVAVECDTGRKRAGVETVAEALALARRIASTEGLSFAGFVFYPPDRAMAKSRDFVRDAIEGARQIGLAPRIVSSGGTPNLSQLGELRGVTEHRAGTSVFNDRMMMRAGAAAAEDCAVHILATVVSRAGPERGILDCGSKTLTSDTGGGLEGFGAIAEYPRARIVGLAEEHAMLDLSDVADRPKVGALVRVTPNHVCVAVNMFDRYVVVRDGAILGEWPIPARGKIT